MFCGLGMCAFVLAAGVVVGASLCVLTCGVKGEAGRKPGSANAPDPGDVAAIKRPERSR